MAAILTGAQLVDYSDRNVLGAGLAALSVVAALSVAVTLLSKSANILSIPRPTATEISNAEMRAGAVAPGNRLQGDAVEDPNVRWLLDRSSYLLSPFGTVTELMTAYSAAAREAQADPDNAKLSANAAQLLAKIDVTEEAAQYRDVAHAYSELVSKFRCGAIIFIIALIAFSISGVLRDPDPKTPSNEVTEPANVRVIDTSPDSATSKCRERDGVAVDGTYSAPTVVLSPTPDCAAETVTPRPELVIVPQP
ncbi:hypothetical protein [Mycolicibacterium sp. 120270]|uniref:hypothetical protein n=1 Tax=Mycolicibacterium sp. 120270 TaxID=3090600 RepID=UPI00299DD9A0|nr:hypothetical protein [Mycolicibacterium sp. 120270]MDX1883056.1 hypothetical protein [Mycolicibacterium sp. 120270]